MGGQGGVSAFRTLMQAPTFGKGQLDVRVFETEAANDESVGVADYKFAAASGALTLSNYERLNNGSAVLFEDATDSFRVDSSNLQIAAYTATTQYLTWEISLDGFFMYT